MGKLFRNKNVFGKPGIVAYYKPIEAERGDFPTFEDGAHLAHLCRAVERSARENGVWADV